VADVPGTRQQKIDNITVNSAKNNSGGSAQSGYAQEDKAAVQGTQNVSKDDVLAAVDDLNKQVKQYSNIKHTSLSFKYHDETNRISITVTDDDTDEVIREIPPEKALDMLAKAWEMAGLLVDEKR
jgi:flagellar protein FlaG